MHNTEYNTKRLSAVRHYARVMTFAVFAVSIVVVLVYVLPTHFVAQAPTPGSGISAEAPGSFDRSLPVQLHIPKLNINTTFVPPLGLNEDKTVSVPDSYTEVGWYKHGATPGEIGPAVILGHVDSYEGPAVFYKLGQLKEGDEIAVTREDGTTATFVVTALERYEQSVFPTELVYGQVDYPALRLVTCSGTYDRLVKRYTKNLVVFARLKE